MAMNLAFYCWHRHRIRSENHLERTSADEIFATRQNHQLYLHFVNKLIHVDRVTYLRQISIQSTIYMDLKSS